MRTKSHADTAKFWRIEPTEELLAEIDAVSNSLEKSSPVEILEWAVEHYAPHFAMATAFGPEGMTMIHMLSKIAPKSEEERSLLCDTMETAWASSETNGPHRL